MIQYRPEEWKRSYAPLIMNYTRKSWTKDQEIFPTAPIFLIYCILSFNFLNIQLQTRTQFYWAYVTKKVGHVKFLRNLLG